MNLAGPAEDFYYSLPPDQKATYADLRDSLRESFANDNQLDNLAGRVYPSARCHRNPGYLSD